ncbi:MAG: hypothetical protein HY400_03085 [Elusimicrobia bacterium]|nr:hypothetical protein [Elusimicrobiota bacterium]
MSYKGLLLALALLSSPLLSFAAFEDLGAGARAPGMGDAFTAVADDVYSIFYNPAGLSTLYRPQFSASYSRLYLGLSDNSNLGLSQVAYAHPLKEGQLGSLGLGWSRFALTQIYAENSVYASYGRRLFKKPGFGTLHTGINLKYLNRSFERLPEAENAFGSANPIQRTGEADPLLSGKNSMGTLDADLGLLFQTPGKYSVGLMFNHLKRPNIAFGNDKDILGLDTRLGFGYKSLWTNLSADVRMKPAPDGSMDKNFVLAGERYIPTIEYGQFGVRGSLGIGSREFRQVTLGLSYRISKIQIDYAFLMPIGTVKDTLGTHRVSLTFHFGAPRAEEEFSVELLEHLRELEVARRKKALYAYEFEGLKKIPETDQVTAAMIKDNLDKGFYAKAYRYINELVDVQDTQFSNLRSRLRVVSQQFPELADPKLNWEKMLSLGIKDFLSQSEEMAVKRIAYAYSLDPRNSKLEKLLEAVETVTGRTAERVPARWLGKLSLVEEKLLRTEEALQAEMVDQVIRLCEEVLELEPEHASALSRLGTAYYLQNKRYEALAAWTQAVRYEENLSERRTLYRAIQRARRELRISESTRPESTPAAGGERQPTAQEMASQEIEDLYLQGVELYLQNKPVEAARIFELILKQDPKNVSVQNALKRVNKVIETGTKP